MASYFVALPLVELNFLASRYFCPNSFCAGFFMTRLLTELFYD